MKKPPVLSIKFVNAESFLSQQTMDNISEEGPFTFGDAPFTLVEPARLVEFASSDAEARILAALAYDNMYVNLEN